MTDLERHTISKVTRRLVPFLMICYLASYLDKVNLGFAALTMNKDIGLGPRAFGLSAGLFFVSYCIFEVPSNLALVRFGSRKWLARIMITWGFISATTALAQNAAQLYAVRMLLGAAEAGFFPGIIFFLTLWFPAVYRARVTGYFMSAIPLCSLVGAPLSGMLLNLHSFGLKGWQWLFVVEALPSLLLGIIMLAYISDEPAEAAWLNNEERYWLLNKLDEDRKQRETVHSYTLLEAVTNPKIMVLAITYFCITSLHQAMAFWLPQLVKEFGLTNSETGFVTAIPYAIGALGMVFWGRKSDHDNKRKSHIAIALFIAALGIAGLALLRSPVIRMTSISIAAFGVFGALPVFWAIPTAFLSGRAAAGGIAFINSIGTLSGFAAPYVIGAILERTGSLRGGFLAVTGAAVVSLIMISTLPDEFEHERKRAVSSA